MTTILQRLLILGGLALTGCGGDKDATANPGETHSNADPSQALAIERLLLVSDHEGEPAPKVVAHYTPDDPERPWRRKKDEFIEATMTEGGAVAHVEADGPSNVAVVAALSTTTFDRIDLDVRIPIGETELLRITLLENSRRALVSAIETVTGTGQFETIRFPLPGIERTDVTITDIAVQVIGDASWTEIRSMDVLHQRAAALLPKPGGEPALIDLGSEARRGWGLDPESGAIWRSDRSFVGDTRRFRFSYATSPDLQGARLEVTGLQPAPIVLELGGEERLWKRFDQPVPPLGPGDEVHFTVLPSEGGNDGPAAVAELQLERTRPATKGGHAPLILLITSDTHRGDHIGRGGTRGLVSTPRIDELGRRGVQFTNAFSSANMTNPSHVSLMTGESPRDTRIVGNQAPLDQAAITLAERFAAAGWATAATVSVHHICYPFSGLGQGFDRYEGPEIRADYRNQRRPGAVAVERALAWMEERDDVPLFLWVHVFDVHGPYEAEAAFAERYYGKTGETLDPALDPVPSTPLPEWIASSAEKTAEVRGNHNLYRAAVDQVDELLGQLFVHPRSTAPEGIVAFTADHGESFGRHELWWTHHGLYPDQIHVPLIVAGGGLPAGLQSSAPVEMISLGATLLELGGVDASEHPVSTLDIRGERPSEPRFALGFSGHKAAIDHEGWLLILSLVEHDYELGPRSFPKGSFEFYHVETDPACERDLAGVEIQRGERMKNALIRWLDDARPAGYATVFNMSAEAVRRLTELGYGGMSESPNEGAWYERDE